MINPSLDILDDEEEYNNENWLQDKDLLYILAFIISVFGISIVEIIINSIY